MATSGSINFNMNRSEIIDHAFRLLSIYGEQETVSAEDSIVATKVLNMMVKTWQTSGIHLWLETEATGALTDGIPSYLLASTSSSRFSDTMVESSLSAAEASGQTVLSITDTDNIAVNDNIGVVLDDGTVHWSTVSAVTSTTATIAVALTDDAASGNRVYVYTYDLSRPVKISSVRLRDDNDLDTCLRLMSRQEYFRINNKSYQGVPTSYYYDPQLGGGVLYLYPTPNSANLRAKITYQRSFEDFDDGSDTPDFPVEWTETLAYNLAVRLASIFDREDKLAVVAPIAAELLETLKGWDNESGSIYIGPNYY
jgi:hypothetical protein